MLIHEPRAEVEGTREIRVKIPTGMHVKLHSIRLLRGKSISDAVTEALDLYFQTVGKPLRPTPEEEPLRAAPAPSPRPNGPVEIVVKRPPATP